MAENNTTEKSEFEWAEKPAEGVSGGSGADEYDWSLDLKDMNKELDERILEANKDATKVKWSKLLPDLMGADVLMIGQFSEQTDAAGNKQLNILMMQKEGHVIIPFFTNPARISAMAGQNTQFDVMKVNAVRFFQSIAGKPCILNPLSDYSRVFTPFEMKILAAENADKAPALPV